MESKYSITNNLNEKQLQAVTTTEGYVRVTAGAGSGKTKALAHRFAYIVDELGISPGNILCVTFTNKAAKELSKRISSLVSVGNVNDFICTYHGFCVKFLREEIYRLFLSKGFVILDEEDQKSILKEIYEELGISVKDLTYKDAMKSISNYKGNIDSNGNFEYIQYLLPSKEANLEVTNQELSKVVILFLKRQLKLSALDFDDLIYFTIHILLNFKEARDKWQNKFHYLMVDETQDNNDRNWQLADLLIDKHKNLFVVGDPDQAIYEWRGAKPDSFINFNKSHQPCTDIIMDENYRSTPNILNVANSVIDHNKNRIKKNLFTRNQEGSTVIHFHGKNEQEEGKWICETIEKLKENGATLSQFAILYRANYISRYAEQALISYDLKYAIYGGIRFFERKEIKDALSYLRLIAYGDDLSFLRVVNKPSRKIGEVAKKKLAEYARLEDISLYDAMKAHTATEPFNKKASTDFIRLIEDCREFANEFKISDLLEYVLTESGLKDMYRLEGDEERMENIAELMHSILLYEESKKDEEKITLIDYLQDIALFTNLDYKEDGEKVKLMTVHQAKGLEFPYVFVIGLSEGCFPNSRAIRERRQRALEEERRLAYVAFTRAEKALFLSESEGFDFSTNSDKYPSRFLIEIKKEFYIIEGTIPEEILNGTLHEMKKSESESPSRFSDLFTIGSLVKHPVFGCGEIKSLDNDQLQYMVKFTELNDEKPISFSFAKLVNFCVE